MTAANPSSFCCHQLILTEPSLASSPFFKIIRSSFIPNRVLIHLDPANPPRELAKLNGTVRSLIGDIDKGDVAKPEPNVRICENFACGLPIEDPDELKKALQ